MSTFQSYILFAKVEIISLFIKQTLTIFSLILDQN